MNHEPPQILSKAAHAAGAKGATRAYHHGDLRASLIAAAREALETTAHEDISLKGLASHLGVSQPAPYRHFADRGDLLMAVATQGFQEFCAELAPASELSARRDFTGACDAYLSFAQRNRGLYRLMFASRLLKDSEGTELSKVADDAFSLLLQRVRRCIGAESAQLNAVWVWSTLHGLAMLDAEQITAGPLTSHLTSGQVVRRMVNSLMRKPVTRD
jgi:AcrR family transcriptional regulator